MLECLSLTVTQTNINMQGYEPTLEGMRGCTLIPSLILTSKANMNYTAVLLMMVCTIKLFTVVINSLMS